MDNIFLDNSDNTLCFNPVDCDGFQIIESESKNNSGIYVYYSEVDKFINCIKIMKKIRSGEETKNYGGKK